VAAAQERGQMRFWNMDANADGVITRQEWRGSERSFQVHDWNGDGVLSGDEVIVTARRKPDAEPDYLDDSRDFTDWTETRFANLDHNRDHTLTRDEWHFDRESFVRADLNRDGRLTLDEFLGREDDDDRDDRLRDLDHNRDGRITRNEWHGSVASFDRLDRDRNDVLTRQEVVGQDEPPANLFASLDVNRDRVIGPTEWHWSRASFDQRDIDRDGVLTRQEFRGVAGTTGTDRATYRVGYDRGLADGRSAGREDRQRNQGWDLEGQRELEAANAGYTPNMGPLPEYQSGYRAGFRTGYREGYGPR
jgi:EF hand